MALPVGLNPLAHSHPHIPPPRVSLKSDVLRVERDGIANLSGRSSTKGARNAGAILVVKSGGKRRAKWKARVYADGATQDLPPYLRGL